MAWGVNLLGTRRMVPVLEDPGHYEQDLSGREDVPALLISYLRGTRAWQYHSDLSQRLRIAIAHGPGGFRFCWSDRFQSKTAQLEHVIDHDSTSEAPEDGLRRRTDLPYHIDA